MRHAYLATITTSAIFWAASTVGRVGQEIAVLLRKRAFHGAVVRITKVFGTLKLETF